MNLISNSQFQCVDCRVWLEQDSAQVVFGKQVIGPGMVGRVGRCSHCGQGLPAITSENPYVFTKNDRPFRIALGWEATCSVFTYVVLKGPQWKLVDAFDLNQLRAVLKDHLDPSGISQDEVDLVKRELYDSADADLWARLVKA